MKKLLSMILAVAMLAALLVPALAAEVTVSPPSWVKAEEYLTFPGDQVYQKETWDKILAFRADAAAGHAEPKEGDALYADWHIWEKGANRMNVIIQRSAGEWFEQGLIAMQYAANSDTGRKATTAYQCFTELKKLLYDKSRTELSHEEQVAMLWSVRARFLNWAPVAADEHIFSECSDACGEYLTLKKAMPVTLDAVWGTPLMDGLSAVGRARIEKEFADREKRLNVTLNGKTLNTRSYNGGREYWTEVVIVNGRTMMPLRWIAEKLGAKVSWVAETKAARVVRAGVQIDLPIGSTTGYQDGKPFQMEVAPYVKDGATMVPVRYVAEFFGLTVRYDKETRTVELSDDKGAVGTSNLEAWALPMGAILNRTNKGSRIFGGANLGILGGQAAGVEARQILDNSWDIQNRDELIDAVCRMTFFGHNVSFLNDVAMLQAMSASEYQQILSSAQGMDKYMFPYTKQLGEKWGERGILCWDLFRMSNLVQWGYVAGYLTYPEALALLEPAANLLHDNFKSWDEAYENYLDGYHWWAREDVLGKNVWETSRGKMYQGMKKDAEVSHIFDNTLFQKPVVGVPDLTAEQLLTAVQSANTSAAKAS